MLPKQTFILAKYKQIQGMLYKLVLVGQKLVPKVSGTWLFLQGMSGILIPKFLNLHNQYTQIFRFYTLMGHTNSQSLSVLET